MATHPSILAWRMPRTVPGWAAVTGLPRVGRESVAEQRQSLGLCDSAEWKACKWFSSNHNRKQENRLSPWDKFSY